MTMVCNGRLTVDLTACESNSQLKEVLGLLEGQRIHVAKGDLYVKTLSQMRTLATSLAPPGNQGLIAELFMKTHVFHVNPSESSEGQESWSAILPEPKHFRQAEQGNERDHREYIN